MTLLDPLPLGPRTATNRILFGPHATNLGRGRRLSPRHVAYYRARAEGGCGTIVVETASVDPLDQPYERCPLADEAVDGWRAVVEACRPRGALVVAGLGHAGAEGDPTHTRRELWSPSGRPAADTWETPKVMEDEDLAALMAGFARAASLAAAADLDGVEIDAGRYSLVRQFLSELTNHRDDGYGADRTRLAREVLAAVRAALGPDRVVGLRLCADEAVPGAGITPDRAPALAAELAPLVDYLVVVRGAGWDGTSGPRHRLLDRRRPPSGLELASSVRGAVDGEVPVIASGSMVDPERGAGAVGSGRCDGLELTRDLIADPDLVNHLVAGKRPRPCVRCHQLCRVRHRTGPVACVVEPRSGHETTDPRVDPVAPAGWPAPGPPSVATRGSGPSGPAPVPVLVVGAGPAGLEAARVAALRSHPVTVVDRADEPGGTIRLVALAPGHGRFGLLADWLADRCRSLGVDLRLGVEADRTLLDTWDGAVIVATGSRAGPPPVAGDGSVPLVPAVDVLAASRNPVTLGRLLPPGTVVVWDPVGASTGVAMAELAVGLGRTVALVTPDPVAGSRAAVGPDRVSAHLRLLRAGVELITRHRLRQIDSATIIVEHELTGEVGRRAAAAVIDCGLPLPGDTLWRSSDRRGVQVGDAVAPRTAAEAIREGRSAALALGPTGFPLVATDPVGTAR